MKFWRTNKTSKKCGKMQNKKEFAAKKMQLCRVLKSTFVLNMLRAYVHTSNLARNHEGKWIICFKLLKKCKVICNR